MRTAAMGELICNNWQGPKINKDNVVAALLIHDLGNIVKIDFETETTLKIIGEERERLDYWKKVKEEVIAKYGNDDSQVTLKMADELSVNARLRFLLEKNNFIKNDFISECDDWELKICNYADQRTGPFGILSLKERLSEGMKRYEERKANVNHPKAKLFYECAFETEKQILENNSLSAEDINDESIKPFQDFQ